MIEVKNASMDYPLPKRYRDLLLGPFYKPSVKHAVRDINIAISQGERVGFLGPNGAGKTTLLKLIGGLLYPTSGAIFVNGIDTQKRQDRAAKCVSIVMNEERSFYWRLTGRENLEFFGSLDGLHGKVLRSRIDELLEMVGIAGDLKTQVGAYSSGMKQRLAMARGLLSDPSILILDEPTRALDPVSAQEFSEFLVESLGKDMKKSLLIATHRLEEASMLCTRLCVLKDGSIRADKTVDGIDRSYPNLMAYYLEAVTL